MKYRGLYIDKVETDGVRRFDGQTTVECEGIWFHLYADSNYSIELDDFIVAYGFDLEKSEESIGKFLTTYIDRYYAEYKEQQFHALLKKDYNDYVYDVKQFSEDFDIIKDAEMIANMKMAYKMIKNFKGITLDEMEYIVTLKRPLETICDYFVRDKNQFAKEFSGCIKKVAAEQICNYGLTEDDDSYDEKLLETFEGEEQNGMAMQ